MANIPLEEKANFTLNRYHRGQHDGFSRAAP
jgi:hypothetical protein